MPSGSTTGSHSVFAMLKKCLPSVASPFHTRQFDTGVAGLDLSMLDLCAGNRDASGISSIFWSRSIETLKHQGQVPWQLVTDKLRTYRAAHRRDLSFGGASNWLSRKQPGRSLTPAYARAEEADTPIQITSASPTISISARFDSKPFPNWSSPSQSKSL